MKAMEVQQICVMAERKIIDCSSVLQAVDTCFKVHHILNAEYSPQVLKVWDFIESFVYELKAVKPTYAFFISNLQ